jgi:hypothetical protein
VEEGEGGPGTGGTWSGGCHGRPYSGGRGRLPVTWNRGREGERGGGVAGMWAGSRVWGPAIGREREK